MIAEPERLPAIDLMPGELHLARDPVILQTILGSCVSVTFWSSSLRIGAMCHGVLARLPADEAANASHSQRSRYLDYSIRYLAQQFAQLGLAKKDLEIKVFGGADVLAMGGATHAKPTVGVLNCLAASQVLAESELTISASDLGGQRGRKIHFNTATGEVLVRRLAAWRDDAEDVSNRRIAK